MPKDSAPTPIVKKPGKSSVDAPPTSKPKVTRPDQDPVSWAIIEKPENVSNSEEIMKHALQNSHDQEAQARKAKATKQKHTLKVSRNDSTTAVDGGDSNEAAKDIEEAGTNNSGDKGLTDNTDAEATGWDAGEDSNNGDNGDNGNNGNDGKDRNNGEDSNNGEGEGANDEDKAEAEGSDNVTLLAFLTGFSSQVKLIQDSLDHAESWAGKVQQEIAELEDVHPMKKSHGKKTCPQSPTPSVAATKPPAKPPTSKPTATKPPATKPAATKPTTAKPTAKPAAAIPAAAKPATAKPTTAKPATVKKATTTSTSAKSNNTLTPASAAPTGCKPYPKMVKLPVSGELVTSRATKEGVLDSIEASTMGRTT
ncbi:DNA ligase [Ceratobasidium theobromae]|uniref:DNA ligase n=1 Tax=Ceratobasidium theobromae TaxID=1582974 RepID=A0A5N5Q855_9AGAM|nr:DNA ligase [Ceratobasidium theobromae]